MSYNFSEEETNTILKTLLMIENIAKQFEKKNDTDYHNKVSPMGKIITNLENKLSIDDELDIRFIKNKANLPPSPIPGSKLEISERKYETLIIDPWDTNCNVCSKAMKDEKKYVHQAIYEKKVRNLKKARFIKYKKQKMEKEKKIKGVKENKKMIGLVSKRRRRSTRIWDPSVSTKWSSIDNDFILIDF